MFLESSEIYKSRKKFNIFVCFFFGSFLPRFSGKQPDIFYLFYFGFYFSDLTTFWVHSSFFGAWAAFSRVARYFLIYGRFFGILSVPSRAVKNF